MQQIISETELVCSLHSAILASFPGSFGMLTCTCIRGESLVSFLRKHDVIGPEQKGHIVQPTMRSTLSVYDIRPPTARYVL